MNYDQNLQKVRKLIEDKSNFKSFRWWRAATIFMTILFIVTLGIYLPEKKSTNQIASKQHIAEIEINGFVFYDQKLIEKLIKIEKSDQVKALIVKINTAGGGVVAAEVIFNKIKAIAKKKPVIANIETIAASAGYLIASAAEQIYAHKTSVVGSIGVVIQWAEIHKLLNSIGIETKILRSGPFKARPNPIEKTPEYILEYMQQAVQEIHNWFVNTVQEQRKIDKQKINEIADGRVFTGSVALNNKLIDQIGDKQDALKWLEKNKNIDPDIEIISYSNKDENITEKLGFQYSTIDAVSQIFHILQKVFLQDSQKQNFKNNGITLEWQPGK